MATHQIPNDLGRAIERAILDRLGVSRTAPVIEGIAYNSDGLIDVQFHLPPKELKAIINGVPTR